MSVLSRFFNQITSGQLNDYYVLMQCSTVQNVYENFYGYTITREHEGTERDTPSHRYVIVTKVIYRLAHKRKCVFRDVRIKTKISA